MILSASPIIISVAVFDQISKYFVLSGGIIITSCNNGFAFSLFPFANSLSALLTVLVLLVVGYLLFRTRAREQSFGLALIFGGGFSNLIDRFIRGCVVDFIRVPWWPSFNLADVAITVGVVIIVLSLVRNAKT